MNSFLRTPAMALAAAAAIGFAAPAMAPVDAFADPPAHAGKGKGGGPGKVGHGKGGPHKAQKHGGGHGGGGQATGAAAVGGSGALVEIDVVFGDDDRRLIRSHYSDGYQGRNCPPGLAKKNNGCMPPGQAKKYGVGDVIPQDVVLLPVPDELVVRLPALPAGYVYRRVDGEVLVVAEIARKVIDIAVLASTL